ncbi:hypothetical protein FA15DRAFT_673816 [Coprinopsis marcescibilis]|uniref:Uncharacterized protein n=1 Tax=Coprinopsis marcescibilis TaxID=230819 RepID=A0A5C3KIV9_COPMA|nr:hypothetical protein FA15DRAFT_673816 [Coprinopsis marcescibilis]
MDINRKPVPVEPLEVESGKEMHRRILTILKISNRTQHTRGSENFVSGLQALRLRENQAHELQPSTEFIPRVQTILPQLQASNEVRRANVDPTKVEITHTNEGTGDAMDVMKSALEVLREDDTIMSNPASTASTPDSTSTPSFTFSPILSSPTSDTSYGSECDSTCDSPIHKPKINSMEYRQPDEEDWDSDDSIEIVTCFVPSRSVRPLPRRGCLNPNSQLFNPNSMPSASLLHGGLNSSGET